MGAGGGVDIEVCRFASLLIQVTVFGVGLYFYLYKPHQDIENLVNTVNGD